MKLKLVMGLVEKEYEIGNSGDAARAINAYQRYLVTQDHEDMFATNEALWNILCSGNTLKKNVCSAISDYSAYKLTVEKDIFKRIYFANVACSCYTQAGLPVPAENRQVLQLATMACQQYADTNPDGMIDALDAAGMLIGKVQVINDEKTQTALLNYTKKVLSKHAPDLESNTWKVYPKDKINIPEMKNDDLRCMKMALDKGQVADKFFHKLKKHGFWAQKQATPTGIFITTNLTLSVPIFKK
ncbi:MAG TPA: hypothetical protein VFU82_05820 [Gammaproteobacteria bacterium]|nr:hypothetical protein [Gammaproteobacteria bacterium]